jgi:saccharopine dehydrogenase-like NADP-dependent oxidoreductase
MAQRILLVGGYGVVGAQVATMLRRHHPALQLLIAGRRLEAAAQLATQLGNAESIQLDTHATDPLQTVTGKIDAVIMLVHDHDDATLRSAVKRAIPYLDITRGNSAQARAYVTTALHTPTAPVLFASNWMAGVPAIIAMHQTQKLATVSSISLSILFYGNDKGGPDSEGASDTLAESFESRRDGEWKKTPSMGDPVPVRFPSGLERPVYRMAMADMMTLAQATGARDVAVRLGLDNAGTGRITSFLVRTGLWSVLQSERMAWLKKRLSHNPTAQGAPHEIVIEITGQAAAGTPAYLRATLLDPAGQSHLTAIGVVANLERLIGLGCTPLRAGIAIPETSPDGPRLLALLAAEGVQASL